ncbi:hypothetical protein GCM10010210_03310 [Pseudonocardia hydrocarbonoxydans]
MKTGINSLITSAWVVPDQNTQEGRVRGPHPIREVNPVDHVTGTDSGGPGLDPDPPRPTGSTHRLTRASVVPVWWSPPVARSGHIVDLGGVLTERRTGRHRALGASRSRLVAGVGRRWTPTNEGR